MKVLISQFRCSKCKTPVKSALVEHCPKCGIRLTTDYVSKSIVPTTIMLILGFIIASFIFMLQKGEKFDANILIFSLSLTAVILGSIVGYGYIKNKKKLDKDKEYIGTSMIVELEYFLTYAEVKIDKKYLIVPILSLTCIFILLAFLVVDIMLFDFLNFDNVIWIMVPVLVFLVVFVISIFVTFRDFNRKITAKMEGFAEL